MTVKIDGTNTVANPAFTGADTDTGLQCGTDELKLVTGGSAQATVNSNGQLLVGTTTAPAFTNRRATIATSSGTTALELRSATDGDSRIIFTDSTDSSNTGAYKGQILYNQTSDYMSFNTNGNNERLRITSDGTLQLRSSPGIDFSELQTNVSGMTSETLDSYEEGTWTPSIYSDNLTFDSATYVKVGRMVTVHCSLTGVTSYNASTGNPLYIFGFPFTTASGGTNNTPTSATGSCKLSSMNSSITTGTLSVCMDKNNTRCRIQKNATNASDDFIRLSEVGTGSFGIVLNVTYYTT